MDDLEIRIRQIFYDELILDYDMSDPTDIKRLVQSIVKQIENETRIENDQLEDLVISVIRTVNAEWKNFNNMLNSANDELVGMAG